MKKFITAAVIATLAISSPAAAAVSVDDFGFGFVGKGDVQLAFGWNNSQLQSNAAGLSFQYTLRSRYDVTCEWTTGPAHNRKTHVVETTKNVNVNSKIDWDARRRNQINGFIMDGFINNGAGGQDVPVVGGSCPNGGDGLITEVELVSEVGEGLTVKHGGTSIPLPNTPVL
jgi:opacity protein-like surface antigen